MSTKEAVTIVSRALAVYFLAWFLTDLTYLPSDLFSLWHHQGALGVATSTAQYWRDSELLSLSFRLFRMVVLFFVVQWFYRAGPAVQGYFLDPTDEDGNAE
jgi:hypothetical protein